MGTSVYVDDALTYAAPQSAYVSPPGRIQTSYQNEAKSGWTETPLIGWRAEPRRRAAAYRCRSKGSGWGCVFVCVWGGWS